MSAHEGGEAAPEPAGAEEPGAGIFARHVDRLLDEIQTLGNLDLREALLPMVHVAVKSPRWAWEMTYSINCLAAYFREYPGRDQEVWSAIYRETAAILEEYMEMEKYE